MRLLISLCCKWWLTIPRHPHLQERTILQFGKVADDVFTMDYSYPMTALQVRLATLLIKGSVPQGPWSTPEQPANPDPT